MTRELRERLYTLLPRLYRSRDELTGWPLRALLAVLEREFDRLDDDIGALYDNAFIETCDAWAIPYLAELVGFPPPATASSAPRRRRVANALAYRRRLGSPATLEYVVEDETGWACRVQESGRQIGSSESVLDARPRAVGTLDVRRPEQMGSFGPIGATLQASLPAPVAADRQTSATLTRRQRVHHPSAVQVYVWRAHALPVHDLPATPVKPGHGPDGAYMVDPLGRDVALLQLPEARTDLAIRCEPHHVPRRLSNFEVAQSLRESDSAATERLYGPQRSLQVSLRTPSGWKDLAPSEIHATNLAGWKRHVARLPSTAKVLLDVELGRALVLHPTPDTQLCLCVTLGMSAELGAGPYPRTPQEGWDESCTKSPNLAETLLGAQASQLELSGPRIPQVRANMDVMLTHNGPHTLAGTESAAYDLRLAGGVQLRIDAKDGRAPILRAPAPMRVLALAGEASRLELRGVYFDGTLELELEAGATHELVLRCCTFPPQCKSVVVRATAPGARATLRIERSLMGTLHVDGNVTIDARTSIIDGGTDVAIGDADTPLSSCEARLEFVTVIGDVSLGQLTAKDTLFTGTQMTAKQSLDRCNEPLPRGYLEKLHANGDGSPHGPRPVRAPLFRSLRSGTPDYAVLDPRTSNAIRRAGSGGSEPGVYHELHQTDHEARLANAIAECLPAGLTAVVHYAT